jgi:hypothetical protein
MPLVLDGTTGFSLPLGAEIGVGTDTPAGNGLHVDHTAGATLRLTRLGTSTSHFVQLETDGAHGTLRSEGNLTLQSGGANPRITVLSTGNIGIGTDTPATILHVKKTGSTSAVQEFLRFENHALGGAGAGSSINFHHYHAGGGPAGGAKAASITAQNMATWPSGTPSSYSSGLTFGTLHENTFAERMRIHSSGNVGIGQTDPQGDLHIGNISGSKDIIMHAINNGNARIKFREGGSNASGFNEYSIGMVGSRNALTVEGQGAGEFLTLMGDTGNVGIGTTSPDGKLTVALENSNTPAFRLSSPTSSNDFAISSYNDSIGTYVALGVNFLFNSSGNDAIMDTNKRSAGIVLDGRGNGRIQFLTADTGIPTPRMTILKDGNVGIGDATPDTKLHVAGNVKVGSASSSSWASSIHDSGGLEVVVGSGSTGLRVWDDNSQSSPRFIVLRSGNVGINTSSPASHLDVKGDLRITRNVAAGHASEGNWNFNISMESASYYGSLYLVPSVSTGELSIMGDKFRVTQSSGVQIISDSGNATSSDNVAIRYNGTAGGHQSGYLFKDKRGAVNAAVKNNLLDDGSGTAASNLEFHTSHGGTLAKAMDIDRYGKVEFSKMPNFATRPYYTNVELGAGAVVDFYDAHVNTGNHFNGTTNRFTAPYAGDYYFAFHSNIWNNTPSVMYFNWHKNGSDMSGTYGGRIYGYYSGGWENMMGFVVLPLAANDYVDLRAGGGGPKVDGGSYGQFIGYALTTP